MFVGTVIVFVPHFTTGVYDPALSAADESLCSASGNRTGVNPYCERTSTG